MTNGSRPISREELQLLNDYISERFGMHFSDNREDILISRLSRRLDQLELKSFMDYYLMLQYSPDGEITQLAKAITNNETYFFRETHQFEALFAEAFDTLKSNLAIEGQLRILCAGCSSGEEPYTINIFAKENRHRMWGTDAVIEAFDLEAERVRMAKAAEYGPSSMRSLGQEQIDKYLSVVEPGKWRVRDPWKEGIKFSQGNIMDPDSYRSAISYDVIFCRNVLIYFSELSFFKAIHNFANCLRRGGLLFLGHSESLFGMDTPFQAVRFGNCIAYRKENK